MGESKEAQKEKFLEKNITCQTFVWYNESVISKVILRLIESIPKSRTI